MKRTGTADLPLHYGTVPTWLSQRMSILCRGIIEAIVLEFGPKEVIKRISDPFWFQSLGAVMGMDWHSSGITTSVMGALKVGLNPIAEETGLYFCGGRGKHSIKTPQEIEIIAGNNNLDPLKLINASRLTARVDNNAVQDGFQLYLHSFILSKDGDWAVVQQGMNTDSRMARRYHWNSIGLKSFIEEPHTAIIGANQGEIINLVDSKAKPAQNSILAITHEKPLIILDETKRLIMGREHAVQAKDVNLKRLGAVLALAYEKDIHDFASLLLLEGLGPRTLQSLALISEVIYGTATRFHDPARFAFALGGKDGHPFPVPIKVYDESINFLQRSLLKAKLGETEKIEGLKKISQLSRLIEKNLNPRADFDAVIEKEWKQAPLFGGRTVFDK